MKNRFKTCFLSSFLILVGTCVSAQTELTNTVLEGSSFQPIESASIYVKNTTIGTVTNADGKFLLRVPDKYQKDTLVVSSIGFKSYKIPVNEFDASFEIYLDDDVASLDEILLVAETRPKTGNDIVMRALEELPENLPDSSYLQKGFMRHKERNKKEFKWLIESAITLYDSSFASNPAENLKINVDQVRKSYDLRDVDSLLAYTAFLKNRIKNRKFSKNNLRRDTIQTKSLVNAIKWNDNRINGLETLFQGKLNMVRNAGNPKALFGEDIMSKHQFKLDTVLVENDRKIYKISISESFEYVNLETPGVFNDGYHPKGWIYVYWDNYAIKKIEYELVAASKAQRSRSKTLYDTTINHKLILTYKEYQDNMYLNYVYYETPKLVNVRAVVNNPKTDIDESIVNKGERFYYTVQEILFTEIITDDAEIQRTLRQTWDADLFSPKPYNKEFWENYNTLLESKEEEKLIQDLTKRYSLFKD
ncbi:carboxypeptidase-like regulatory domain-containing protein [Bizionia argentinensis JUB59]|uniref:Carboxypeptidase-like regulatory domain-containing protein n=1 Tax=Bizionia argentinensis JUB59 TaxID=1046627 RepID=G2EG52_9FLAO|nr:carboxypeptidase-like regulatory domain-containing protein [Bizionia argentinensis]EGV42559.1 carboxypeptidase-like regulatory domain-containing protein [Bizionia argentinensis JUB59]